MGGFASLFSDLKTPGERRREGRLRWKKIKAGAKAKSFRKRIEASKRLSQHREQLDEKGILQDDFDFLREPNPRWLRTRVFILKRDRFRCYCCGAKSTRNHVHHKLPRRYQGSSDSKENLVTICPRDHSWVDLEIWRRVETGATMQQSEIRATCLRVLEQRKKMVQR